MEEGSLKDRSVLEALKEVVAVAVNIDDVKSVSTEFAVKSVPWLIVIDPLRREKIAEHVGYASAEQIVKLLAAAKAKRKEPPGQGDAGVRILYKRTGLSIESPGQEAVIDLWAYALVQGIESTGEEFDGDTWRLRHARAGVRGVLLNDLTLFLQLDFAADRVLQDVYAEYQVTKPLNLRVGRGKVPMGTAYQPRRDFWDFVEPSGHVTALLPRRDVGALLFGGGGYAGIFGKYWIGYFNGVADGYADADNHGELAARFTLEPWPSEDFDLQMSWAWTGGESREGMGTFRVLEDGVVDLLRFPATVVQDGYRQRISLEAELLWRNLALGAERVTMEMGLASGGLSDRYDLSAFQAWAAWLATGEKKSRDDWVVPARRWGALEVVLRHSRFHADGRLRALATAGRYTEDAAQTTVGVNWYLNRFSRLMLNVSSSSFEDAVTATTGALEDSRRAVLLGAEVRF